MREPRFWHGPPSLASYLLRPLAALYGVVAAKRMQREGLDTGVPVICVGNYHVGGAGKTPTVLALAKLLRDLGETPVVLSRGYGGKLRGPIKVDPARHVAADVGDEPLMLAASLPVVVSRQRADGVPLARSLAATVILMDDGFQSPAVTKDASLIVIDGHRGLGNGQVFPPARCARPCRRKSRAPTRSSLSAMAPRRKRSRPGSLPRISRCCARILCRAKYPLLRYAAGACWPLPASATPQDFLPRCRRAVLKWFNSAPSQIIMRYRNPRSTA